MGQCSRMPPERDSLGRINDENSRVAVTAHVGPRDERNCHSTQLFPPSGNSLDWRGSASERAEAGVSTARVSVVMIDRC